MPTAQRISDAEWDAQRDAIYSLYKSENKSIEEVIAAMREDHGFTASLEQYRRKFKKWGWAKHLPSAETTWRYVDAKIKERKRQGKESQVFLNGEVVAAKRVKKETSRHARPDIRSFMQSAPSTPEGGHVLVQTPCDMSPVPAPSPAAPLQPLITWTQLPWLLFEEFLTGQLGQPTWSGISGITTRNFTTSNEASTVAHLFTMPLSSFRHRGGISSRQWQSFIDLLVAAIDSKEEDEMPLMLRYGDRLPVLVEAAARILAEIELAPDTLGKISAFYLVGIAQLASTNSLKLSQARDFLRWAAQGDRLTMIRAALRHKTLAAVAVANKMLPFAVQAGSAEDVEVWFEAWLDERGNLMRDTVPHSKVMEHALRRPEESILRFLLSRGFSFELVRGWTPHLERYASKLAYKPLLTLINAGAKLNAEGRYPIFLQLAISDLRGEECVAAVKLLLDANVGVHLGRLPIQTLRWENSPIYLAVKSGDPDLVSVLLQHGANPNTRNKDPVICFQSALEWTDPEAVTPLAAAVQLSEYNIAALLLRHGASALVELETGPLDLRRLARRQSDSRMFQLLSIYLPLTDGSWEPRITAPTVGIPVVPPVCGGGGRKRCNNKGIDPNRRRPHGTTQLHNEICYGKIRTVRSLLNLHADPNATSEVWWNIRTDRQLQDEIRWEILDPHRRSTFRPIIRIPPLVAAVQKRSTDDNLEAVRLLVAAGADLNPEVTFPGLPLLEAACLRGHPGVVRFLLEAGTTSCRAQRPCRDGAPLPTAAEAAMLSGSPETLEAILHSGAGGSVDPSSTWVTIALAIALQKDHDMELAKKIIALGADVRVGWRSESLTSHLIHNGKPQVEDKVEVLALLRRGGAPVDDVTLFDVIRNSEPPFGAAAADRQREEDSALRLVGMLLDAGVRTEAAGSSGCMTALEAAVKKRYTRVCRLLLEQGADPDAPIVDRFFHSALGWACRYADPETVELLLSYGAEVNISSECWDDAKFSPLQATAFGGNFEIATLLLSHGAHVNAQIRISIDKSLLGMQGATGTALHMTARNGDLPMTKLLLEWGADLSAEDNHGCTPLDDVSALGRLDMVAFLLANDSVGDENARRARREKAAAVALDCHHYAVAELLRQWNEGTASSSPKLAEDSLIAGE